MHLNDVFAEILGHRGHERNLERAGRDHDLLRLVRAVVELDEVPAVLAPHRADATVQLHGETEMARVAGEVVSHLVARRITIRIPGEVHPGQGVVARGREQLQRVPAPAPSGRRLRGGLENREVADLLWRW